MKIRPVRAELFHADRRTDITTLVDAFRNFAKAPKKELRKSKRHWTFIMFQLLHNLLRHHQLILCFTEYLHACSVVTTKRYSVYLSGRTYRLEILKRNDCFVYFYVHVTVHRNKFLYNKTN
jgi:hypothetical protein